MEKPLPQEYRLPADYDWNRNRFRIWLIEHVVNWCSIGFGIVLGVLVSAAFVMFTWVATGYAGLWLAIPMLIIFWSTIIWSGLWFGDILARLTGGEKRAWARQFGGALWSWQYDHLESGRGYWEHRTSRRYGKAVIKFLTSRGCKVEEIAAADSWTVDLIVSVGGSNFYCRCDGNEYRQLSPDIIGDVGATARRCGHRPIIFARCAGDAAVQKAADEMGVLLLRAGDLMAMARSEHFEIPRRPRSILEHLRHDGAMPEILARWPVRPSLPPPAARPVRDGTPLIPKGLIDPVEADLPV